MSYKNKNLQFWLFYFILVTKIVLTVADFNEDPLQEFVICRQCGADVADSYYLYNHLSPESFVYPKQTVFGKADIKLHELVNPFGIKFTVINTLKALCSGVGDWHNAHSWYPGFAWRHCVCPHCGIHLGWIFEPIDTAQGRDRASEKGFYALIVPNLMSETFTKSLMIMPSL